MSDRRRRERAEGVRRVARSNDAATLPPVSPDEVWLPAGEPGPVYDDDLAAEREAPPLREKVHPAGEMDAVIPTVDDERVRSGRRAVESSLGFSVQARGADAAADLAAQLGADFLSDVTGAGDRGEARADEPVEEELGGPFVITGPDEELGDGDDANNPPGTEPEPFPRAV